MKQRAIIFDRDGTLASVAHVAPTDLRDQAQWGDFNAAMPFDAPVPEVVALLRSIHPSVARIMVSGRAAGDRVGDRRRLLQMTDWIRKHDLPIDHLFMRRGGDNRRDDVVKLDFLQNEILPRFDVRFVVDDRQQVVDMWRAQGLPVLQVKDPGILPALCG
jgi:hypothetical protein